MQCPGYKIKTNIFITIALCVYKSSHVLAEGHSTFAVVNSQKHGDMWVEERLYIRRVELGLPEWHCVVLIMFVML
jgi:hypothetical protein